MEISTPDEAAKHTTGKVYSHARTKQKRDSVPEVGGEREGVRHVEVNLLSDILVALQEEKDELLSAASAVTVSKMHRDTVAALKRGLDDKERRWRGSCG